MAVLAVASPIEIIRKNAKQRVNISVINSDTGLPIDATQLDLSVTDLADSELYSEDFFAVGNHRIVKPAGTTGQYYIEWGPAVAETGTPCDLLFNWHIVTTVGSEDVYTTQVAKIVSSSTLSLLPYLQTIIDKSVKAVNPDKDCYLGYTTDMLLQFIDGGLQLINSYQPYVVFSLETYPITLFREILLEASLYVGIISQLLFAVDQDVNAFSDQGQSFTINHQAPLSQFSNELARRLDTRIPAFKMHFVSTGSSLTQMGPAYRLQTVLTAAPSGSLFRNLYQSR